MLTGDHLPPSKWIHTIIPPDSDFPLDNLPWGVFANEKTTGHICTRVGNHVVCVRTWLDRHIAHDEDSQPLPDGAEEALRQSVLNSFMELGPECWRQVRRMLSITLRLYDPTGTSLSSDVRLLPIEEVSMLLPISIGDYTDFYCSREHATTVGAMFRSPENALQPNWLHLPVGYHGRASSIMVSGAKIHRPWGQILVESPVLSPSKCVDYELEMACVIGRSNQLGSSVSTEEAAQHIFGYMILNDWSARDIQKWEYVPLGPFNSKNFATVVSPWIVTAEALQPFKCAAPAQDPTPLAYLQEKNRATFDIQLQACIQPGDHPTAFPTTQSRFKDLYWTFEQMIAHHTIGGCNLRSGDILASGTLSSQGPGGAGCLLELTRGGAIPLELQPDIQRAWLEDGDTVTLTAWCEKEGLRVGFGECTSTLLPAVPNPAAHPK